MLKDATGNRVSVGDILMNRDGFYKVMKVYSDRIYYDEITFDEDGNEETIRQGIPMAKFDVAKCEKF